MVVTDRVIVLAVVTVVTITTKSCPKLVPFWVLFESSEQWPLPGVGVVAEVPGGKGQLHPGKRSCHPWDQGHTVSVTHINVQKTVSKITHIVTTER